MRRSTRTPFTRRLALCLTALIGLSATAAADDVTSHVSRPSTRPSGPPSVRLVVQPSEKPDTIVFAVSGKIEAPLARQIEEAFDAHKGRVRRIVLKLNSGGGSVRVGRKTIDVLQKIKETHTLDTEVEAGRHCGSMCVFIFAQGQHRSAAAASLWLFHEISFNDPATGRINRLDREKWFDLIDTYLEPAGVSPDWIADLKRHAIGSDYWRTGEALVRERSGLIHETTSDEIKRRIERKVPEPSAERD